MFIKGKDNSWARLGEEEKIEFEKEAVAKADSFKRKFYKERVGDRDGV